MDGFVKYCPKCSKLFEYERSKADVCDFCDTPLIESDISNDEQYKKPLDKIVEWRKTTIETNPMYDRELHERMKNQLILSIQKDKESISPRCPPLRLHLIPDGSEEVVTPDWISD